MKSVIYGAGSIGRGFIGQLFSESDFEVVFIDQNKELIDQLNGRKSYPIRFVKDAQNWEIRVVHVRGIWSSDEEAVIDEISTADLMATSVGKNVLPVIAPVIASALRRRWKLSIDAPLNIIVCENMVQANGRIDNRPSDCVRDRFVSGKNRNGRNLYRQKCTGHEPPAAGR